MCFENFELDHFECILSMICKHELLKRFKTVYFNIEIYTVTGQPIFMEIIFSRILSVPIGGPPNGILVAPNKFANHWNANRDWSFRNLVGATKIPFGGPPMGTLRIREKIISIEMGCFVTLYISSWFLNWRSYSLIWRDGTIR